MPDKITTTYAELRDDDVLIDKSGGRWHVSGVSQYVDVPNGDVGFWLGDVRTKVRAHHMTKPAGDPCTVERVELLRDTVEKLEAGWPKPEVYDVSTGKMLDGSDPSMSPTARDEVAASPSSATTATQQATTLPTSTTSGTATGKSATTELEAGFDLARNHYEPTPPLEITHDEAVAAVEQGMPGAVVEADSTAAEVDAAAKATEEEPVVVELFETMTDLEQRSHLFVLHGVLAEDIDDRKTRADLHAKAHSDRAQGKLKSRHTPHVHTAEVKA